MKTILLLLILLTATVRAEERFALLIGNAAYEDRQSLNNPINDVRGLQQTLEALDFRVRLLENGSLGEMEAALNDFGDELEAHPGSTAFFYYSGHGHSQGGTNYLMPLHSLDKIRRPEDLKDQAISDAEVLSALASGDSRFRFFFLDACRSVRFPHYSNKDKGSLTKGLAPINSVGSNTMIFYATAPGQVALDGHGRNSPFARALMQRLAEPLSLAEMVQRVTDDVATATHEQQTPWSSSSLRTPFYFKKPSGHEAPARSNTAPAETAQAESEAPTGIAPAQSETTTANTPSRLSKEEQKQIFEEAEAADDEKNYARALELYQRLAAAGHGEAMYRIGKMYRWGEGVAKDYASAKRWYEKAGDAGYSDGYWWIGWLYREGGPGLEQNYATAKKWYEKVIAAGDSLGYLGIGDLYKEGGPGIEQNYATAKKWYEKAGDAGNSLGYKGIGRLYLEGGPGLEQNYASAKQWYEKAGDAGDSDSYWRIGPLYEQGGPGLEKDLEQACRYYRKAGWQSKAEEVCSR